MSDETQHDVIVIGAGMAGLTAARGVLQAGLSTALLEAQMFGGLILNVNELDGESSGSGADLSSNLMGEISDMGVENLQAQASALEADGDGWAITSDSGVHKARAVIVASGAALKKLGVPGEAELEYKGVSHCADCDGPLYDGQDVVVVGGGDSALQSAMVLSKFAKTVHLIHRGPSFRAKPHWVAAVDGAANVQIHLNAEVEQVLGTDGVEGVRVRAGGNTTDLPCHGFFALVGLEPVTDFLPSDLARDARGALVVGADLATALPGVYAAGVVRAGCGGMIEDAVADGEAAARAVVARLGAAA